MTGAGFRAPVASVVVALALLGAAVPHAGASVAPVRQPPAVPAAGPSDAVVQDPPPGVGLSRAVFELPLSSAELDDARESLEAVQRRQREDTARVAAIRPELAGLRARVAALDAVLARRDAQVARAQDALERAGQAVRAVAVEWFVTGFGALDGLDPALTAEQSRELAHQFVLSEVAANAALDDERHLRARVAALRDERTALAEESARDDRRADELDAELARRTASLEDAARRIPQLERRVEEAAMGATVTGTDLSATALDAYWRAQRILALLSPACRVQWWLLAGIGRTESHHGTYLGSELGFDGLVDPPIFGPYLDGSNLFAIVPDSDGGSLDGTARTDRATGPMQFLPGTWRIVGLDADGDGVADPQNLFDAAASAGAYLCRGGRDLASEDARRAALLTYNRSLEYVDIVLERGRAYESALDLDG